jgi:hypothetical protein
LKQECETANVFAPKGQSDISLRLASGWLIENKTGFRGMLPHSAA